VPDFPPQKTFSTLLFYNFIEEKTQKIKSETWCFCYFEIKTVIHGVSMHICTAAPVGSSLPVLFTTSYFSSHGGPGQFKISIFIPVQ
jgi:hypothetical protein